MTKTWLSLSALLTASILAVLLPAGCSKSDSPTTANNPTPTPTSTAPYIVGMIVVNGSISLSDVWVADSTGNTAPANTAVSFVSAGVTTPMNTLGNLTNDYGITNTGAPPVTGALFNCSMTYNAGQVYTYLVGIGSQTYTASVTGIAGNPVASASSSTAAAGVTCSWSNGVGNVTLIRVLNNSAQVLAYLGPPVASNPYTVANSVFTNETPGAGTDSVVMCVYQYSPSAFPGAQSSSCVLSGNLAQVSY